jgi:hypothetical protein
MRHHDASNGLGRERERRVKDMLHAGVPCGIYGREMVFSPALAGGVALKSKVILGLEMRRSLVQVAKAASIESGSSKRGLWGRRWCRG